MSGSYASRPASDFVRAMGPVARALLGEPSQESKAKRELRFGTRGSLSVSLDKGTWHDHEAGRGGGVLDLVQERKALGQDEAVAWLQDQGHIPKAKRGGSAPKRQIAAYDYTSADGELLFQVVRFEPKDFRPRRPDGRGGWHWNMQGVRRVLYRLPQVLAEVEAGRPVYIAEGEKAADAVAALGAAATCSPGGAGKWRAEYGAALAGAHVVVLSDNDPQATTPEGAPRWHPDGRPVLPGQDHAADVAKHLQGIAASVQVVMLPGLPLKGDVADWIAAGGTLAQLEALSAAEAPMAPAVAAGPAHKAEEAGEAPDWVQYLQREDSGAAIANLANAMTALRSAEELQDCFAFDEMQRSTILVGPVPKGQAAGLPRPVTDSDVGKVQEWLQRNELRRLGKDIVHQAVDLRAGERAFHPVRDYLGGLRWDGVARLGSWLHTYLGAEWSEETKAYLGAVGTMFLISMVARVMQPGSKVDYMLILEGDQGAEKSTVGETLAGPWFSDNLPDIGSDAVRLAQHLRGKWLLEIGELSAMSKTETETLKAFLTRRREIFTPKYGRREVDEPRQCVFIGTTNRSTYLRDETGARRFWPVKVGTIDTAALAQTRDQLFAEAMHRYRAGTAWWPDKQFERDHFRPQQDARFDADAWEGPVADWLAKWAAETDPYKPTVTALRVAQDALFIDAAKFGRPEQLRITGILERLGWVRGARTRAGRPWLPGVGSVTL